MADKFDHHDAAQQAVNRMNAFLLQQTTSFGLSKKDKSMKQESKVDFKHTLLIWDTGATHGLTPFMKDFIHYHPCDIPVKDISKVDRVIGVSTVKHKFQATNGKDIFLPGVFFHLPTADIRLMSPQSYHQRWAGYSLGGKEGVLMNLWRPDGKPSHVLKFQLDEHLNTPTVVNVSCTAEVWETIGPYLWSSCARHLLAFNTHDQAPVFEWEHNFDTDASLFQLVADPSNINLTPGQNKLLLWHWRWRISMSRIQELKGKG
jgi:hypothetical protein